MKTLIHKLFRALVPAALFGIILTLVLPVGSVGSGNTKIAPTEATPPHPFTIIDTPEGRLTAGAVALFTLNGRTTTISLETHNPGKTAHGMLPSTMVSGTYQVSVKRSDGTTFTVGAFDVLGSTVIEQPSISPTSGTNGDSFVISDPEGRMVGATLIVFFAQGQGPEQGTVAQGLEFSADGTEARGKVPGIDPGYCFVTVHMNSVTDPPLFNALSFVVT